MPRSLTKKKIKKNKKKYDVECEIQEYKTNKKCNITYFYILIFKTRMCGEKKVMKGEMKNRKKNHTQRAID